MKRMTPAEAAEWRRKSVERYRAKRQKPTTPQRARKQAEDSEYAVERQKRFVRARGRCEVCTHPVGEDWQSHHKVRRSHRVDHSADNLLVVHPSCHLRVHTEIAWAREQGFISTAWRQME